MPHVQLELPARVTSPGAARRAIGALLIEAGVTGEAMDDALLLVSELVTNAVHHARSAVEVMATLERCELRLRVSDHDPSIPLTAQPSPGQVGGWGLHLVECMCSEWGWDVHAAADGKTVWANLPLAVPHR